MGRGMGTRAGMGAEAAGVAAAARSAKQRCVAGPPFDGGVPARGERPGLATKRRRGAWPRHSPLRPVRATASGYFRNKPCPLYAPLRHTSSPARTQTFSDSSVSTQSHKNNNA
ncbi:hypothetical protein BASA81_008851 [Batrachochytrium salamandrivorans]|nr:hypothetical protein BASA81_008851 [Batrachochytrium salamandrivorans]